MKVLVGEFSQESNSFCPVITEREDFMELVIAEMEEKRVEVSGMIRALSSAGHTPVMGPMWRAQAGGPVRQTVVDQYVEALQAAITDTRDLSAICLSMHGATQSTECDDVCGDILKIVREMIGPDKPIAVSLDLHANVTAQIYENADFVCGYQTYPHRDLYETGERAATLCCRNLAGQTLFSARVPVPMIVPASGYTTACGAFGELASYAQSLVADGRLLDYTMFQMQPWLDVPKGASSVLTVADRLETAEQAACELAERMAALRHDMQPQLKSPDAIIDEAEKLAEEKPIIVADFSDSPNAGASGDNVVFLERLLARKASFKAAIILNDSPAVERAFACGVGNESVFHLGGTRDPQRSHSIEVRARVRSLHDGTYLLAGPIMRGVERTIGYSAVLTTGKIDILVCHAMAITGDIQLYRHFGIEPEFYQLVLVKANTSFRAAYSDVAGKIYMCDTKGSATCDLTSLPFRKLPHTFFPFSELDAYSAVSGLRSKRL